MKHTMFLILFTVVTLADPGRVQAQAVGKTHLIFSSGPTTSYTPSVLEILKVESGKISGKVYLQFDIGPQARAPMEWEKTQVLAFSATPNAETGRVEFVVEVPQGTQKLRIAFQGYFFSDGVFGGMYSVNGKERGAFFTRQIPKPATNLIKVI